ncbi:MAG: carboxypeptidase-like regulatory domain-containing protein [Sphingobacterium sp.]|jgi:hypothetical protein|nr:carboxypeptidase-like regulatory domain-containing protein [Sphingobacterium sp.]
MNINFLKHARYYLTVLLLTAFYIPFSAASFAQKVTIRAERSTLKSVLLQLEKQSAYRFLYADESLTESLPVTITKVNADFNEVLTEIFKTQPLEAHIQQKNIIIKNKQQQSGSISGIVTHYGSNVPMRGVTIKIVGNSLDRITISDELGQYSFADLPYGTYQLSYSYVGCLTTASLVQVQKNNTVQNASLTQLDERLEQVVVIGYGTKQQKDLTSSVSSINQEKLADFNNNGATFESILGGAAKGVMVTQNSGAPGATAKINIRGITSPCPEVPTNHFTSLTVSHFLSKRELENFLRSIP